MENPSYPEKQPKISRLRIVGRYLVNVVREAHEQLQTADLNPHEGRLRESGAPEEHIQKQIPDYPPDSKG